MTVNEYEAQIEKRVLGRFQPDEGFYLYGAGLMGRFAYKNLHHKYNVKGFIDGSKEKCGTIEPESGLEIFSLSEIPKDSQIVITSETFWNEIINICSENGFNKYCFYEELMFCDKSLPHWEPIYNDTIRGVIENKERFQKIYALLSDSISKDVMQNVLQFRLTLDIEYARKAFELSDAGNEKQYFDTSIIQFDPDEVFIDCGGYCGETSADLIDIIIRGGGKLS